MKRRFSLAVCIVALAAAAGIASSASAQTVYAETEPNDTKATAQGPLLIGPGDSIIGNAQGAQSPSSPEGAATSADYYLVRTPARPLAIYRYQLQLTSANSPLNSWTIRGLGQSDGFLNPTPGNDDVSVQSSSASTSPASFLCWYGFGKEESAYIRVNGTAALVNDYTLTLSDSSVSVIDAGTMPGGVMTISSVGQTTVDTDLWIYDSNLDPIPGYGNDNAPAPLTGSQSSLTRDFAVPGVYYVAITDSSSSSGISNNQTAPRDDRLLNGQVLDSAGMVISSASGTNIPRDVSFQIIDGAGVSHPIAATKALSYEIVWVRFEVVSATSGTCCLPDGTCIVASEAGCALPLTGGMYAGDGVDCGAAACVQPATGACCDAAGVCTVVSSYMCAAADGYWGGAGVTCAAADCAGSIETRYPNTSLGNNSAGVFLDITANDELSVRSFDLVSSATVGVPLTVQVWTCVGSYGGQDNVPSAWTLRGTMTAASEGQVPYTHFTLDAPIAIEAGTTTGVCLIGVGNGIKVYTLAADPVNTFTNDDLTVFSDRARTAPFAGSVQTPRSFGGRIYYSVGGETPCQADFDGNGTREVPDIFAFLSAWFASDPSADIDGVPGIGVPDIFAFLSLWFAGCP